MPSLAQYVNHMVVMARLGSMRDALHGYRA